MSGPAAATLLTFMVDPGMPPAIRLRSADYVLNPGVKTLQDDDLEARLAQWRRVERQGVVRMIDARVGRKPKAPGPRL